MKAANFVVAPKLGMNAVQCPKSVKIPRNGSPFPPEKFRQQVLIRKGPFRDLVRCTKEPGDTGRKAF